MHAFECRGRGITAFFLAHIVASSIFHGSTYNQQFSLQELTDACTCKVDMTRLHA